MEPTFAFRPDDHTYWIGREPVLGCTEVLKTVGILDDQWYEDGATDRGSRVHRYTAAVDRQLPARKRRTLKAPLVENNWLGYADSWDIFKAQWRPRWLLIEQPLCDGIRRIAGSPDRVAILEGDGIGPHVGIPDLKTGDFERWHTFQGSIYILLVITWMQAKRQQLARLAPDLDLSRPPISYGVYLRADGTEPKVRTLNFEPTTQAVITAAQIKRSLHLQR